MKFNELIHELECDYGRINFREKLMLRRAYDAVPEKDEIEYVSNTRTSSGNTVHRVANTTAMICSNCGTPMVQQQYFGGGVYWLCGKCGAKIERTGI